MANDVAAQLEQHPQALVSGVEPDMYASLRKLVPGVQYHARAKMLIIKPQDSPAPKQQRLPGSVCVISAGPEDQAAADQVKVAAEHMGCYVMSKQNISTRNMPQLMEQMQGEPAQGLSGGRCMPASAARVLPECAKALSLVST